MNSKDLLVKNWEDTHKKSLALCIVYNEDIKYKYIIINVHLILDHIKCQTTLNDSKMKFISNVILYLLLKAWSHNCL